MDKQRTRRSLGWIAGLGSALICGAMTAMPATANPPLDLVTGGQSVAALKEDGLIYMQWGFQSLAIDSFRGAMALEDKANVLPEQRDADVPFNLGLIYLNKGDLKGARRAFERSLEADPTNFKAHYHLGLVELQMGNEEEARQRLQLLETAAATDPQVQAHLQDLMASLAPLPAPQPNLATQAEDLESTDQPELTNDPPSDQASALTVDSAEQPEAPDLFSDEITGVTEFGPEEDAEVETEADAVETEEARETGLSRFRRGD